MLRRNLQIRNNNIIGLKDKKGIEHRSKMKIGEIIREYY